MDVFNLNPNNVHGGAYFISGDDGFLVKTAEDFFKHLLPEGSLSLHIIDKLTSVEEISSCLGVYSFDGSPNVVIIRDTDVRLDDNSHSALLALLSHDLAPDYAVFSNVNFLSPSEKKCLVSINCDKPDRFRCVSYMEKLFPFGIEKNAAFLLTDYSENNLAKINNDSIKLTAYCGERKVTVKDVEILVAEEREVQVFSFANSIINGNNSAALKSLEKLRSFGIAPATVLSTLSNQFQRMLFCSLSPLSDEELASLMKIKPFAVKKAREGKKIGAKQLKSTFQMLVDCEYRFKSGEISDDAALNIAVNKLLRKE